MTGPRPAADPDGRLLREALVVVRSARERAPADFLIALAVVLGGLAIVLLVVGLVVGGTAGELCRDLAVEVGGAWLTVVLVDGLWRRAETGAATRLRAMETALQDRIDAGATALQPVDREGWQSFVATYGDLTRRTSLVDRVRAARDYGRRAHELTERGEALLEIE